MIASNIDLLEWFSHDERTVCGSCNEQARVTLPGADAFFCLACAAVTLHGVRIDVDRRLTI